MPRGRPGDHDGLDGAREAFARCVWTLLRRNYLFGFDLAWVAPTRTGNLSAQESYVSRSLIHANTMSFLGACAYEADLFSGSAAPAQDYAWVWPAPATVSTSGGATLSQRGGIAMTA